jgi:branched-chain amino acid transport system ATP-binding protein
MMTTTSAAPILEGRAVTKRFGGLVAVKEVDFAVYPREIVGLIGPNGSGKTTLFDCLSRVQPIDEGQVFFKGEEITNKKPHEVAHLGMARTFQVIRVYRKLTVLENMNVSRQWRGENLWSQLKPSDRRPGRHSFRRSATPSGTWDGFDARPRVATPRRSSLWSKPDTRRDN